MSSFNLNFQIKKVLEIKANYESLKHVEYFGQVFSVPNDTVKLRTDITGLVIAYSEYGDPIGDDCIASVEFNGNSYLSNQYVKEI